MSQPAAGREASAVPPRLVVPEARIPVRLEKVDVRAEVIGLAVQTRVELVFRNPNERVLEGELQFPLREGQTVTGFALDINGELRAAVPVEKAKGQQVFEDVIRARVDPALLEATRGNNYKLRVYPLPARGTRRVVLDIAQTLARAPRGGPARDLGLRFDLPLSFADRLDRLDVDVRIADVASHVLTTSVRGLPSAALTRTQEAQWAHVSLHRTNFSGGSLAIGIPGRHEPFVATQDFGGQTYFYAEVPARSWSAPRAAPRTVALLWDASGSGAQRDHGREFAVLDAYFKALRNLEITLVIARDVAEAPRLFVVRNGRWDELRRTLEGVAYDGATNLSALVAPEGADLALLFSDGLGNWGPQSVATSSVPLYALSAAASLDVQRLRFLAERSGGQWLDLAALPAADAARALQTRKARLLGISGSGARQLVSASPHVEADRVTVAGVLTEAKASIELEFGLPDGGVHRQRVSITRRPTSMAGQRWAALRVAELEANFEHNRAEVRRLGKAFGLPTRETSLIVLDAVADYARHEIEPPASLRPEYERLLAQQMAARQKSIATHLDRVASRFVQQVAWWERSFPKGETKVPFDTPDAAARPMPGSAFVPPPMAAPAPAIAERAAQPADATRLRKDAALPAAGQTAIQLTKWEPDSPYARRLREASPATVYQRYLDERPDFTKSTAFFLDAADILFQKGLPHLGLRVLSNLAEMELENRHILRVLAYRLLQAKQSKLAIAVLQTVRRLSPDEPQSHRDLGLAYAEDEQWQEAVNQLWWVVSRPWNSRFPDIDLSSLAELNAIAARAAHRGKAVDVQAFDARLMRNLPLDLRVVLGWDADNTDIDLWVIDPNGEKAYYGHRLTYQGGRMSQDVTGGYGPEEFALRHAKPGKYTVLANFYGHRQQVVAPATTLTMRLTTGFGTPQQRDEIVTLRLAGQQDMITVGSFEVGR